MLNNDFNTPTTPASTEPGFTKARKELADLLGKQLKTKVMNNDLTVNEPATSEIRKYATRALLKLPRLTTLAELEQVNKDMFAILSTHQNLAR